MAEREQSRARYPDETGYVERDGVRIHWERYGHHGPNVVLLPTWSIVHSRFWKGQIHYLARHFRVVTIDGRGNGRSGRPRGAQAYSTEEFGADTVAVMDATGTESATLVALSCGALWAIVLADEHPERVQRIAFIGPAVSLAPNFPEREAYAFEAQLGTDEGWAKYNTHYWARDYRGFLEFFAAQCHSEPHSTKQIEDFVGWGLATTPEVLADTVRGIILGGRIRWRERCARVKCPVLVIHGDRDQVRPHAQGVALAQATGGHLVTLRGSGHMPAGRDPVRVNLLLRKFISGSPPPPRWTRAQSRPRRALYISSPIGLGHVRRDLAIARELRRLHPDLRIEWLAQDPVAAVLQEAGEYVHPAGAELASESAHFQSEHLEHDLHCFQALRRMDEILVANFMVFHDLVRDEAYDLWVGDEAWDVDHFLHENPDLKTAPYVWLTDFVGWLPMPDGGPAEATLTADYNAEMIGQIERYPNVRDRALFIGQPQDIVPEHFGPGLPPIRAWTEAHYRFSGYVTDAQRLAPADRALLRAELGFGESESLCVATVGGSGVGEPLLRRLIAAYEQARSERPELRMIIVTGPRIDRTRLPSVDGVELLGYVPDLPRYLSAADLALVQGGLSTGMELVALGRPFIAFPLGHHFEQSFHVRHRLERYGARRFMDFSQASTEAIATAIGEELSRVPEYLPVARDGARRAAGIISELL